MIYLEKKIKEHGKEKFDGINKEKEELTYTILSSLGWLLAIESIMFMIGIGKSWTWVLRQSLELKK